MDQTAMTLCKENNIPVVVFSLMKPGNIIKALTKKPGVVGTTVDEDGDESADEDASSSEFAYDAASL